MAIGSPPPAENGPASNDATRARPPARAARFGAALLIAMVVVAGAIAWRSLRSTTSAAAPSASPAASTAPNVASEAPRVAPTAEEATFAQRLLAAADGARRGVVVTAHVAAEARELVKSLVLVGGFPAPPTPRAGETWSLATGDFDAGGRVQVTVPAAWPRLRALTLVRRDGTIVPLRDLALVAAPFDRGELLLPAGGPIRGRVTSEGGGAVGGARVAIFDVDTELLAQFEESALGVTTTDEKGGFAFKGVAERHVRLEVTGVTGRANAVVPDAELFEAPLAIELAPAATIRGRLVDAAGAPIGDGRVGAHLNGPVEESAQRSAATDRDGAFTLDALAPGYYTLFAIADGCATQTIAQTHTDVAGLVIKLDRLASAHLVILNAPANLETPVVWRTAEPSGVTFRRTSSAEVAWCRGRELVVSGVPPGRHALELALPGAAPIVTSVATFAPNETTELGSLTLQPGAELSLRVTDVDGRPVRARVALASPQLTSNAAGLDPFALDHDERITDADGRCRWPDLPAGKRVVAVRSAGAGADALAEFEVPERGRVELPPLVIRPAGAVAGRVRARKGPPLAGMLVQVEGVGASRSATTDLDGRYEVRGLLPGNYVVTVIRRDEAPPRDLDSALAPRENPTAQVEVAAGATTPRDFEVDLE